MTHHDHVEMLIEGIDGEWIGRVGRRRQAMRLPGYRDDIGRVTTTCPFGVIHMNGTALHCGQRVFQKTGFIQCIGVQLHLKIIFICNR